MQHFIDKVQVMTLGELTVIYADGCNEEQRRRITAACRRAILKIKIHDEVEEELKNRKLTD